MASSGSWARLTQGMMRIDEGSGAGALSEAEQRKQSVKALIGWCVNSSAASLLDGLNSHIDQPPSPPLSLDVAALYA